MESKRKPAPIGEKFGKLTLIKEAPDKITTNGNVRTMLVKCDCGVIKTVQLNNLINGMVNSCGCSTVKFITEKQRKVLNEKLRELAQTNPNRLKRRIRLIELRLLTNTLPENKRVMYRIKMDKLTEKLLAVL